MRYMPRFGGKRWLYLLGLGLFYLSFSLSLGLVHAADAGWYIESSVRVSPLYPLLLNLLKLLFTERLYLQAMMVFQQLLLAYAIFSFSDTLEKEMGLRWYWRVACCAWLAFMLFSFRLLVIGVGTETFFCNAILTEGIAYPLYLLFIKYWFLAVRRAEGRALLGAAAIAFLLTSTRGQFYWLLIALCIGLVMILRRKPKEDKPARRKLLGGGLIAAAAYALLTVAFSVGYHYAITGAATGTTLGAEVTVAAVLYDCDMAAADFLPEDSEERIVLENTLREAAENGWTVYDAKGDWQARYRHYEGSFDMVRLGFLGQIAAYHGIDFNPDMPAELLARRAGQYAKFLPRLIVGHFGPYMQTRLLNFLAGMIRSNATMNLPGTILSAAVYLLALIFLLLSRRRAAYAAPRLLLRLVLLGALLNALFCCWGVFALSRYMYYSFPLIYLALALFFPAFLAERKARTV